MPQDPTEHLQNPFRDFTVPQRGALMQGVSRAQRSPEKICKTVCWTCWFRFIINTRLRGRDRTRARTNSRKLAFTYETTPRPCEPLECGRPLCCRRSLR